jgi:tetratricopeptide (TPR) repeat protein
MTTPARFLLLVLALVAAAAPLMLPRADEWLAMLRDTHKQAEIVAMLEPRLVREGDDPTLLAALGRAHADLGNYTRAIELFERCMALRPDDAETFAHLADLYRLTGNATNQREALERAVALAPKLSRVAELVALLQEQNEPRQELALLERLEPDLTVQSRLRLRLAQLQAQEGETDRAIATLDRPDITETLSKSGRNDEERLLLATLLVEVGRSGEAARLGRRWVVQWQEPWLAGRLLTAIAAHAPAPDSAALADAVAKLHPAIRFFLVKGLFEQGARETASHLLRTWPLANPRPSADELAAFLSACRQWGEPAIIWEAFSRTINEARAPEIIARYSEAIVAEYGLGALAPFWSRLPPAVLEGRPLLGARLAFAEQNPVVASLLLGRVDIASLTASDQQIWADLLSALAPPEAVFSALDGLRRSGALPPGLLAQYARLAGSLGHDGEYRATLAALRKAGG